MLVSYLQALLLTSAEIQNFASLQCLFDPTTVRAVFAVATPVLPMLLLITCGFVDVARPGTGDLAETGSGTGGDGPRRREAVSAFFSNQSIFEDPIHAALC